MSGGVSRANCFYFDCRSCCAAACSKARPSGDVGPANCFYIGFRSCCGARFGALKASTEAVALLCNLCCIGRGLPCESFPCRASLQLRAFAAELRCSFSPLPRAARLLQAPERRRRPPQSPSIEAFETAARPTCRALSNIFSGGSAAPGRQPTYSI